MWEQKILPELTGRQPSKIKPECASEESFLGDALSERHRDRIDMKAVSLMPYALPALPQTLSRIEGSSVEGRLTQGHGLHHRCSVLFAMHTLLNVTKLLLEMIKTGK
jgi:hypothetical protein